MCGWYNGREVIGTASRRLARLTKSAPVTAKKPAKEKTGKA